MMGVRLPNNTQRVVCIGRTGTGKTVAGLWHLSNHDLQKPWIVLDFKNDEHINSIDKARHIDFDFIPDKKDKGLFILHPMKADCVGSSREDSTLEKYLWKIHHRENCGVFCDETFMVGNNDAFDTIQTQGRSKRIPVISCTQRPCWVTRFVFSEADFIQTFHLNDDRDRDTVTGFTPLHFEDFDQLKKHQSFYYDVSENKIVRMNPVPNMDSIRKVFDEKLERQRVRI